MSRVTGGATWRSARSRRGSAQDDVVQGMSAPTLRSHWPAVREQAAAVGATA